MEHKTRFINPNNTFSGQKTAIGNASFNVKLRAELLNGKKFCTQKKAQQLIKSCVFATALNFRPQAPDTVLPQDADRSLV